MAFRVKALGLSCVALLLSGFLLASCGSASRAAPDSLTTASNGSGASSWDAWSTAEPWTGLPAPAPTLFPARQRGEWGYIDKTGRVAISFSFDEAWGFSDGLAIVKVGNLYGYIDESGNLAIAPQYLYAGSFSDGLAWVNNGLTMAYINKKGTVVFECPLGSRDFSEGLAPWSLPDGVGGQYRDASGKVVIDLPRATSVNGFNEGLAAVQVSNDGPYGYIDRTGQLVIKPQFYQATPFNEGVAVVQFDLNTFGIIDKTGRVVRRLEYDYVGRLEDGRAAFMVFPDQDKKGYPSWGYLDANGTVVIPASFSIARDFSGGLASVDDKNGKMGYINLDGQYIWREQ